MKVNHQSSNIHTDTMDTKLDKDIGREAHRHGFVHPFRRGFSRVFRSVLRPFSKIHRRQSPDPNNLSPESFIDRDVYGRGDHTVTNDTEASHIVEALHEHQDVPINVDHPFNIKSRSTETSGSRIPAAPESVDGKSCRFSTVRSKTFLQTAGDDALISPLVETNPSPSVNQSDDASTRSARRILRRLICLPESRRATSSSVKSAQLTAKLLNSSPTSAEYSSNFEEGGRHNALETAEDTERFSLCPGRSRKAPRLSNHDDQLVANPSSREGSLGNEKPMEIMELNATRQSSFERSAENRRRVPLQSLSTSCVNPKVSSFSSSAASNSNQEKDFSTFEDACTHSSSSGTTGHMNSASESVHWSKLFTKLTTIDVSQLDKQEQVDENKDGCGDEYWNSDLFEPDSDALELALESVSSSPIIESDSSLVHMDTCS